MSEELKNSRKARKSALTREVNTTLKFVEGGIKDEVEKRLEKIKSKFTAFEEAHEVFHITLIDEADISESDNYFDDVQSNYISTLQRIDAMLRQTKHVTAEGAVKDDKKMGNESKAMVNESPATTDNSNVTKELVSLINLPRLEIQPYEGDPLKFHNFFATFDEAIDRGTQDPGVKLTRLLQYTQGRANAAIASCAVIGGEAGYKKARDTLKSRFGNHHLISDTVIKQLKSGCPVKSPDELLLLSDELNNCMTVLENLGKLHEVDTQSSIVHIVDRLQPYLRNRWRNDAMKVKREKDVYPSFEDLVEFVSKAAEDASDPVYGQQGRTSTKAQPEKFKKSSVSFSTGAEKKSLQKYPRPTCILCGESHRLFYCQTFKNMKPVERLKLVRERKLCENCLLSNHVVENCRKLSVCSVPGCGLRHTKFIHIEPSDMFRGSGRSAVVPEVSSNQVKVTNNGEQLKCATFIPIVPVMVNNKQEVSALLDTASNSSFCTRSLIDELGIQGKSVKYILNTMSKSQESRSSCIVNFALKSKDGKNSLQLSNVYVVDNIPVKIPCIDWSKYPHLQDLPIGDCPEVHILIGQDNSEALVPMEVRRGQHGDPFAVRTLFGWSLNGPALTTGPVSRRVINHFISSTVEDEVNKLWNLENEGCDRHSPQLSHIDREVMESWDNRVTLVDGHYEVPIPWKKDVHVPNNVNVAQARLKSLCVNLKKLNLYEKYDAEIRVLLDKCYAEPVPLYDVNVSQIWYLPHHCVTNDNKPGKIRVVFDCSSRFEGESLNDKCNQGPEMNNKLVHVLLRFREHEVAIMADIEAMYHQVLVPVVDRDALRFLWYDNTGQAMHYRMTRHVFGGVWSGSAATYALRRTVADYGGYDSLIDDTVLKSFYVDDCLRSVMSEKEAVQIIKGTKSLLQMSGFKLTKFVSNNMHVLENVTECDRAKECKDLTSGFNSRALGVKWNFLSDEFKFDLCIENKEKITRRNMLSLISSMYDPLGLVSPVLIFGKVLFQDATRLKLSWDEEVPPELQGSWMRWLQSLHDLQDFRVPRCVKPSNFNDAFLELHHFSDASERAYGSCSYLRCINKRGEIYTSLLFSKSKVAPIKPVTIPRLELQAALLSARIDSMLRNEMSLELTNSYFWIDSEIALKYIKNDTRRFHVYVSNRTGEIRRLTEPDQWYHVAGKDNPADIISRGQALDNIDQRKWFEGPDFIRTFKSGWQHDDIDTTLFIDDPEVKPNSPVKESISCVTGTMTHPLDDIIEHYSSWTKIRRAVAWLLRLKEFLRSKKKAKLCLMSVSEIKTAENLIFKHVQGQIYEKEIKKLNSGSSVDKSSSVSDLSPVVDENGLLCVGGRLNHANLSQSRKHPCIVPHKHPIALKIVSEIHEDGHPGTEWTLSLLRAKYWVTNARSVIKNIRHKCIMCKRLNASPCVQQMASLPAERLQPDQPPFTYVGVDYFGPFMVKFGRGEAKKYGCIYTCLTTRAIHLEKIDSLDTDSFLNGFRRFIARRGLPRKVWSDNGTNFVGGLSELKKGLRELQQYKVHNYCLSKEIDWIFNPPHSSHMGGVWERLIRTVRKVFTSMLMDSKQRLTDEVLRTLFCEVESIINNRPITKVSSDATDLSPLTPNHLLLLSEGPKPPPGLFSRGDMFRRRWRYVQHLADQFWRRWVREYIPELQKRHKWTNKCRNLKQHDLVLLCEENTPRGLWPLGIVIEANQGRDGLVRSVKVKTKSTVLVRPITKVVSLEGD